jgi:maltose alpha-D-glucosyltransferase/alpha-amylase
MATADAVTLSPGWITAQRWFRAKARPVASVTAVDAIHLTDAVELRVVEVAYADGGASDRYLVPLAGGAEPDDGDGAYRTLVAAMAGGAELPGDHGRLRCDATPALAELLPSGGVAAEALDERRLRVEQTNTSVVLGERLILKLIRLVEPGISPDVEVGRFLGEVGFADTPRLVGWATYLPAAGEPCTVAILQAYASSSGDAWAQVTGMLAADDLPAATRVAGQLGGLTRRLHDALASRPDDAAFPARRATSLETAAWRSAAEGELAAAIGALGAADHDRLVAIAPAVRAAFADAFGRATGAATVSRIHGDYHLGQVLVAGVRHLVIDFEGEPARPLAQRRAPGSPLRDVAGMLRSLDYAARSGERRVVGADGWLQQARAAFIEAYGGIGPSEAALIEAFELEKACYEVRYEANNRPTWLWLPLEALERSVAAASR